MGAARDLPGWVALVPIGVHDWLAVAGDLLGLDQVGIVLNLPTIGRVSSALTTEDMFLAASTVMISMALTPVGTFVSDILLAILDPRIQYV